MISPRPDFAVIRNRLKPLRQGMKDNIMDQARRRTGFGSLIFFLYNIKILTKFSQNNIFV